LSYRALVNLAAKVFDAPAELRIRKRWQLQLAALLSPRVRDVLELLPRYAVDNLFVSDELKARFPDFAVTPLAEGLRAIRDERRARDR